MHGSVDAAKPPIRQELPLITKPYPMQDVSRAKKQPNKINPWVSEMFAGKHKLSNICAKL